MTLQEICDTNPLAFFYLINLGFEIILSQDYLRYGGEFKFQNLTQTEFQQIESISKELVTKIRLIIKERDLLKNKIDDMLNKDKTGLLTYQALHSLE